jgi:hypothetical protein
MHEAGVSGIFQQCRNVYIADQVFSYFVKTCIIIIIIIIIIIKGEQAVKWRMQNNQSDHKNTDERIFRRVWGRSGVEKGCV